jgi:hypothetical protein
MAASNVQEMHATTVITVASQENLTQRDVQDMPVSVPTVIRIIQPPTIQEQTPPSLRYMMQ